jgi:hypothetical protein
MRAAHERGISHAMQADVVYIAAFAGDETLVFLARNACANTFYTHILSSLTGAFSAIQIGRA